ncbi:hypothetical protein [Cyclobacterium lianum]|uniref:hypothetical protein n=1 Tax=Cyclobacterium lianum TaxID=388280 RepID=UPI001160E08C|nr:hypothetical protein [Cyclobacterium lianum]
MRNQQLNAGTEKFSGGRTGNLYQPVSQLVCRTSKHMEPQLMPTISWKYGRVSRGDILLCGYSGSDCRLSGDN